MLCPPHLQSPKRGEKPSPAPTPLGEPIPTQLTPQQYATAALGQSQHHTSTIVKQTSPCEWPAVIADAENSTPGASQAKAPTPQKSPAKSPAKSPGKAPASAQSTKTEPKTAQGRVSPRVNAAPCTRAISHSAPPRVALFHHPCCVVHRHADAKAGSSTPVAFGFGSPASVAASTPSLTPAVAAAQGLASTKLTPPTASPLLGQGLHASTPFQIGQPIPPPLDTLPDATSAPPSALTKQPSTTTPPPAAAAGPSIIPFLSVVSPEQLAAPEVLGAMPVAAGAPALTPTAPEADPAALFNGAGIAKLSPINTTKKTTPPPVDQRSPRKSPRLGAAQAMPPLSPTKVVAGSSAGTAAVLAAASPVASMSPGAGLAPSDAPLGAGAHPASAARQARPATATPGGSTGCNARTARTSSPPLGNTPVGHGAAAAGGAGSARGTPRRRSPSPALPSSGTPLTDAVMNDLLASTVHDLFDGPGETAPLPGAPEPSPTAALQPDDAVVLSTAVNKLAAPATAPATAPASPADVVMGEPEPEAKVGGATPVHAAEGEQAAVAAAPTPVPLVAAVAEGVDDGSGPGDMDVDTVADNTAAAPAAAATPAAVPAATPTPVAATAASPLRRSTRATPKATPKATPSAAPVSVPASPAASQLAVQDSPLATGGPAAGAAAVPVSSPSVNGLQSTPAAATAAATAEALPAAEASAEMTGTRGRTVTINAQTPMTAGVMSIRSTRVRSLSPLSRATGRTDPPPAAAAAVSEAVDVSISAHGGIGDAAATPGVTQPTPKPAATPAAAGATPAAAAEVAAVPAEDAATAAAEGEGEGGEEQHTADTDDAPAPPAPPPADDDNDEPLSEEFAAVAAAAQNITPRTAARQTRALFRPATAVKTTTGKSVVKRMFRSGAVRMPLDASERQAEREAAAAAGEAGEEEADGEGEEMQDEPAPVLLPLPLSAAPTPCTGTHAPPSPRTVGGAAGPSAAAAPASAKAAKTATPAVLPLSPAMSPAPSPAVPASAPGTAGPPSFAGMALMPSPAGTVAASPSFAGAGLMPSPAAPAPGKDDTGLPHTHTQARTRTQRMATC